MVYLLYAAHKLVSTHNSRALIYYKPSSSTMFEPKDELNLYFAYSNIVFCLQL